MADMAVSVVLRAVDKMTEPVRRIQHTTQRLSGGYRSAGSAADAFAARQQNLRRHTEATNRVLARQQRVSQSVAGLRQQFTGLTQSLQTAKNEAGSLGLKLGVIAGVSGWGFKRQFVDTASEFERFQTILETTEGSSDKAKQAMNWVSDFATKTPYELAQVNEAFVKLRAYGLDPKNGLLKTLGDTASAMGKDLIQAVEAMADAVTGENERLKEFGVTASTKGDTITYAFTNKAGEQSSRSVDKNDRRAIQETLSEIFDQKYSGAMERLSRTWTGMVSNLADQWTRFANMVMETGVFELMKEKLEGVLAAVDKMADNGQLQAYAKSLSDALIRGMTHLWQFGVTVVSVSRDVYRAANVVADALGGWQPVLIGLASMMAGRFVWSLLLTGKAMVGTGFKAVMLAKDGFIFLASKFNLLARAGSLLRVAFAVTPIGMLVTAITVAAGLIYRFWDQIKAFGQGVMSGFSSAAAPLQAMFAPLMPLFRRVGEAIGWVIDGLSMLFEPVSVTSSELTRAGNAGKQFGEWLADALTLALTPLSLLIDGIQWVVSNIGKVTEAASSVGNAVGGAWEGTTEGISSAWDWAFGEDTSSQSVSPLTASNPSTHVQHNSTITVVQQPGEDGEALARRIVQEELRLKDKQNKAQQRGALFDYQEAALP